jgi:hypothetical protein
MDNVRQIDLLLNFIPYCKDEEGKNEILNELGSLRRRVSEIEEMTKTERQRVTRLKTMTIESNLNLMPSLK